MSERWYAVEVSGDVGDRVEAIFGYRRVMVTTPESVRVAAEDGVKRDYYIIERAFLRQFSEQVIVGHMAWQGVSEAEAWKHYKEHEYVLPAAACRLVFDEAAGIYEPATKASKVETRISAADLYADADRMAKMRARAIAVWDGYGLVTDMQQTASGTFMLTYHRFSPVRDTADFKWPEFVNEVRPVRVFTVIEVQPQRGEQP